MSPTLVTPVHAGDHAAGPEDAPVTLVEYGDYECPHCGRAYPIVRWLQEQMGTELRFVFRNFPLSESHPHAQQAAEAAEAAGEQGEFWGMHDMLFEHQDSLGEDDLVRYAGELGLDEDDMASALESGRYTHRVRDDFMGGVRSGVNGTPTFFVNGERFDGDWGDAAGFLRQLRATADGHAGRHGAR
jgi:protein-disulfide isomerase